MTLDIVIFEEHSSVLPTWKQREIKGRTLIYLDAHLDLQFVSPERIEALKQCTTAEELAKLEKPHHLMPDRGYSYSIEDFLYPAHCLGMIDQLVWVNPPDEPQETPQEIIDKLQSMEGVTLEEMCTFKVIDHRVEGTMLGLNIIICEYHDLPKLDLPKNSLIDIDTDYFVSVPQDKPWIDPRQVFETLKHLHLDLEFITITRSVSSGYMPLRYRFFTEYLSALWRDEQEEANHYGRLFQLDSLLHEGNESAVVQGCSQELQYFPNCAATYYLLSLVTKGAKALEYRRKASSLDSGYRPNLLRSLNEPISRKLDFDENLLQELENKFTEEETSLEELSLAHVALGLLYSELGNKDKVIHHYEICQSMAIHHPLLELVLAKMLMNAGETKEALHFINSALLDDMTSTDAHALLGRLYVKQGNFELASESFSKVSELKQAWSQPVKILAKIYKTMGQNEKYEAMQNKYDHIELINTLLVKKLNQNQ